MKLRDIVELEYVKPFASYLIYNGAEMLEERLDKTIEEMHPGKETESMLHGLNRMIQLAEKGNFYYSLYSEEECQGDPQKKDVNILFFPALKTATDKEDNNKNEDKDIQNVDKPFILVCPGGAYMNVWSFTEGYTAAARYNEYGYDAFILTYRTGGENLFPKPMEDVAKALKFIKEREDSFGVNGDRYIVNGFSAGGNLTLQWGTKQNGYAAYDLPKPEALFPIYPVVSFTEFLSDGLFVEMAEVAFGKGFSQEKAERYEVLQLMDEEYPPVFDAYCLDDDLVPPENSSLLKKKLEENGIPYSFFVGNIGGHGFSEGLHTDCSGWIQKAVDFYEGLPCSTV